MNTTHESPVSKPSPELQAYRVARLTHLALLDSLAPAIHALARKSREAAASLCTPAKAKKLAPLPAPDGRLSGLHEASDLWRKAVPKARHAELDSLWDPIGQELAAIHAAVYEARHKVEEVAYRVPEPVRGAGASWRLIRSFAPYDSGGSESYARGKCAIRYHELKDLGHHVRAVTRLFGGKRTWLTFELWAWVCDEGQHLAYFQSPPCSLADYLNRLADHGMNPIAATNNACTFEQVEAAGAWKVRSANAAPPVPWQVAQPDEDVAAAWPVPPAHL